MKGGSPIELSSRGDSVLVCREMGAGKGGEKDYEIVTQEIWRVYPH